MRLNGWTPFTVLAAILLAAAGAIQQAEANFADAAGFSGRTGATCAACHTMPSPTHNDARANLEGLPTGWVPGEQYALTARVLGGPEAMPAPQPQGGFDLAVGAGRLSPGAGFVDLLRSPHEQELTYTPAGTLMRSWNVTWTAPGLSDLTAPPAPITFWLAVISANGNHVIASNVSDGGERFDSSAAIKVEIPPAAGVLDAWTRLPLTPPEALAPATVLAGTAWIVKGTHSDSNATTLRWRIDAGGQNERATGPAWSLQVDLPPGEHSIEFDSLGAGRQSEPVRLDVLVLQPGQTADPRASASLSIIASVMALFVGAAVFYKRQGAR